jgi:hypothetical protein
MKDETNSNQSSPDHDQDHILASTSTTAIDMMDFDPSASTSKAIGNRRKPKATPIKKPKKIAACDSCKHRRVLCAPVPPPGSCSRCMDKGIQCTTTPVVRKKPVGRTGKRIEESRSVLMFYSSRSIIGIAAIGG